MTTYTLIVRNGETVANCAILSEAALYALRDTYDKNVESIDIVDADHGKRPAGSGAFDVYRGWRICAEASGFVAGVAWAMGLEPPP